MSKSSLPLPLKKLINEFSKLPSLGEKSATRIAINLITKNKHLVSQLKTALEEAEQKISLCEICFTLCEGKTCNICSDPTRDHSIICVVEKPSDQFAIEKSSRFNGVYHVLHGLWSPMRGVSPDDLKIEELLKKAESNQIKEIILATGTTIEGDATAMYIAQLAEHYQIKITRIAQGLPKGGDLEYSDEVTLSHALEGRRDI